MNKKITFLVATSLLACAVTACGEASSSSDKLSSVNSSSCSESVLSTSSKNSESSNSTASSSTSSTISSSSSKTPSSNTSKSSSSSKSSSVSSVVSSSKIETKYKATLKSNDDVLVTLKVGLDMTDLKSGSVVEFKVTAKNSEVIVNGGKVTGNTSKTEISVSKSGDYYSFTMPKEDITIEGVYEIKRYSIAPVDKQENHFNMTTIGITETFVAGAEAGVSISAMYGYKLISYSITGVSGTPVITLSDNGTGTVYFTMPKENVLVNAVTQKLYQIEKAASEHTSITLSNNSDYIAKDTEITFTVTVNSEFYLLDTVSVQYLDGSSYKDLSFTVSEGTYAFVMPEADVKITTTEKAVDMSGDPFASKPMTFEGQYEYNDGYTLYTMRLRFVFSGSGTLAWYISYDYDEDWGEYWYINSGFETIINPHKADSTYVRETALPSGMEGSYKQGFKNVGYLYNPSTDQITFTTGFNTFTVQCALKLNRNVSNEIVSIAMVDNFNSDGYYKTKDVICTPVK